MNCKDNQSVKDRIVEFIMFKNISTRAFENAIGVANGYFSHLKASPKTKIIQQILREFPELNRIWLLTGEGEMLKNDIEVVHGDKIIQSVGRDNNGTMIGRNGAKFAGVPDFGKLMEQLMEQNKKQQEQIDRLLGIIETINKGK